MKNKSKIFIVTEGGPHIGFGHITRCIAIQDAFAQIGVSAQLIINYEGSDVNFCKKIKRCRVFNWMEHQSRLFGYLGGADIVIVDSYLASPDFYKKISKSAKVLVSMDDNKRLRYPKGIVVNGCVDADKLRYPGVDGLAYLLGSCYIPIRKEFWSNTDKNVNRSLGRVMITLGGGDAKNTTAKVLRLLVESYPSLVKNVVIGEGFANSEEIENISDSRTKLIYCPDASEMKKTMLASDVAISAGGQTLYELARVGVPAIAILAADNQRNNMAGFTNSGFIKYAGSCDSRYLKRNLNKCLCGLKDVKIRKKMSEAGREIVDGLGAHRVVRRCMEALIEENMVLRTAQPKDMREVYELSNDRSVRKNSFNAASIKLAQHEDWFRNKIIDARSLFLVARFNNDLLGQIRFDKNKGCMVVSISVRRPYRQLGAGKIVIRKAIIYLMKRFPSARFIKAFTRRNNIPSQKLFEAVGFKSTGVKKIKGHSAIEYRFDLSKCQEGHAII